MTTRRVLGAVAAAVAAATVAAQAASAGRLTAWPVMPWDPSQYDGAVFTADAPDLTTLPAVHAVYLYPSDAKNRSADFAAMFQRDTRRASAFLEASSGRAYRWDERLGADGATRYLDISVIRSKYSSKRLGGSQQFSLVKTELSQRGFTNPNKKYLVWLDAPSSYCGRSDAPTDTARSASNAAEGRTVSAIFRYYDPARADGGFCSPLIHELAHAMGAVLPVAPHYTGGHCNDNGNDLLCLFDSAIPYDSSLGGYYLDYGDDDYWDAAADPYSGSTAKLSWWTVNLSRFLCPPGVSEVDPVTGEQRLRADCASANATPGY